MCKAACITDQPRLRLAIDTPRTWGLNTAYTYLLIIYYVSLKLLTYYYLPTYPWGKKTKTAADAASV